MERQQIDKYLDLARELKKQKNEKQEGDGDTS